MNPQVRVVSGASSKLCVVCTKSRFLLVLIQGQQASTDKMFLSNIQKMCDSYDQKVRPVGLASSK